MDIILDSNIYLTDIRLRSNRFANFFDYVRRTRSSIILPALVRDEVAYKHREKLTLHISRVEKELKELRRYAMDNVVFHAPYLKSQSNNLKALLRRPSKGIRTKFLAHTDGVDLSEVIRRGINRIPPASESGEELRDVILWLVVLEHAKSSSRPVAFVTADRGFWETDNPKTQILQDIDAEQVDLRLYKDLGEFTKDNALVSETVTNSWIQTHIKESVLEETILNALREHLKQPRRVSGDITDITTTRISFVGGSLYKVDTKTDFAELWYQGSFVVQSVWVRYQPSLFDSAPTVQRSILGGYRAGGFGATGLNQLVPLSSLLAPRERVGETYKSTYDVDADIRVSCRVEGRHAELEVDEVKLTKIAVRE